jgi:hypothetical protein
LDIVGYHWKKLRKNLAKTRQNIGKDFLKISKIVQKITKQKNFKKNFVKSADF